MSKIVKSAADRGDRHTGYQSGDPSPRRNPLKPASDKPRCEVYPTDEVPHKWAHQAQSRARNAQGNLFFDGPTIYSYRTSWPLARIYAKGPRDDRQKLALSNCASYSVTTGGHQSAVNQAVGHLLRIAVPHVESRGDKLSRAEHRENVDYLLKDAADALTAAQRAQKVENVDYRRRHAHAQLQNAALYCGFFGLRWVVPDLPAVAWSEARARAERIENPDPASKDKRERASAARKAANAARDEYLAEQRRSVQAARRAKDFYRIGAARSNFRLDDAWSEDYESLRSSPCMLRLDGGEIETSWGARIPAAAAPMVWAYVQRARRSENGLAPCNIAGDRRPRIGDYPLDRIDADGTLHAGCHTIPYSELAAMARTLGLAS